MNPGGHFALRRAEELRSERRSEQPSVAGDMVNKSASGDLLRKWHAGDNIHALPAFTYVVAPGHPCVTTRRSEHGGQKKTKKQRKSKRGCFCNGIVLILFHTVFIQA